MGFNSGLKGLMNSDLEEMWNGAVVVQFQVLPADLPGVTEKITYKFHNIPRESEI